MPYELRVFRGIEILLALIMILGMWILFWLLPLFDSIGSGTSISVNHFSHVQQNDAR